ncbi:MAG: enoyl-CoA hydratase/isomerase family protein [Pseudomonadota bacterium]
MDADLLIRTEGRAGRITLNRPDALNALTYAMANTIEATLRSWANDPAVDLVIVDAAGDRAFCAGGDIQDLYDRGMACDYDFGRRFWRDEYRLNHLIATYPKPFVAFAQGFVMGGGVGVACHGSHRIVGATTQVAMPECGIGLVPDVGGSLILARSPGRLGEYLGMTGARMGPGDAIYAGFADTYLPEDGWPNLIRALCEGDPAVIAAAAAPTPAPALRDLQSDVDRLFAGEAADILAALDAEAALGDDDSFAARTRATLAKKSPIAAAATPRLIQDVRAQGTMAAALRREYRFTSRASEHGDFLEGIRAAIIDRGHRPAWRDGALADVTDDRIAQMLAPLEPEVELTFDDTP